MDRAPSVFTVRDIVLITGSVSKEINGKWVPARPIGLDTIINRFKCAYMVFTGRADVVIWPEQQ